MRKIYLLSLFLISLAAFPQGAPKAINYQGVARNTNGDPIVGSIGVKVEIHSGASGGPVVCSEIFHVNTNQFGIFELRIGSVSPLQFATIAWGTTKHFIGVALDPTGGNTFGADISNQEFISVPYALYAENSGNAGPSTTITSSWPSIISVTSAPPSHTVNYTPPQLMLTNDTILQITQGTHTSAPVVLKAGAASATALPLSPWSQLNPNVFLVNGGNNVGIGTSSPGAKLEVVANPTSTNNAVNVTGVNASGMFVTTSAPSNVYSAIYANNVGGPNSGSGIIGVTSSSLGPIYGVVGQNAGNGAGVYGYNIVNSSSASASGVIGETNSNNAGANGVTGINNGAGAGVSGSNNSSANVATAHGVRGETSSPNSAAAGVFGQNLNNGYGVYGLASANTFSSAGVYGKHIGFGSGVHGEANTTSSIIGAVEGMNNGMGPALKGTLPTGTMAGASNAALLIENGHIWATTTNAPSYTLANNTATTIGTASLVAGSNDVRGMFVANVTPTANWTPAGYYDFVLIFQKPYLSGGPWVTIAKYDGSNYIYEVVNVTTTSVTFRIRNGGPGQLAPGSGVTQLRFMYMVMN